MVASERNKAYTKVGRLHLVIQAIHLPRRAGEDEYEYVMQNQSDNLNEGASGTGQPSCHKISVC